MQTRSAFVGFRVHVSARLALLSSALWAFASLSACETESCNDTASCEVKPRDDAGAAATATTGLDASTPERDDDVSTDDVAPTSDEVAQAADDVVNSADESDDDDAASLRDAAVPTEEYSDASVVTLEDSAAPTTIAHEAAPDSSSSPQDASEPQATESDASEDPNSDPSESVVVCITSNDCSGSTPNCVGGRCRACVVGSAASCNSGEYCVATSTGPRCATCDPVSGVGCTGATPACILEPTTARCATCDPTDHDGCSIFAPFCTQQRSCVECLDNEDCDEAASCVEGACVDVMVDICVQEEAPDSSTPPDLPPNAEGILCVPEASGVPGMVGGPQWWADAPQPYTKLDDPRWVGATSLVYPDLGQSTRAVLRVVIEAGRLHFSFHALEDPLGVSGEDWAYVALTQDETSPAKIVGIRINTNTISEDVQYVGAGNFSIHYFDAPTATALWGNPESTDWANNIGVWNLGPDEWAINFTVDLADVGISGNTFRMWTGLVILALNFPDTFVTYGWPMGTTGAVSAYGSNPPPGLAGTPDPIFDVDEWGAVVLGTSTPCTDGITLRPSGVGVQTEACLVHQLNVATDNVLTAQPSYRGVASGGVDKVAARWRVSDCGGSPSEWLDVPGFEAVASDAAGAMSKTCTATEGSDACPGNGEGASRKCALVNLLPGSNPGQQPLRFLRDSAYFELDVVEAD